MNTIINSRPLPKFHSYMDTAPFWRAANDGRLMIQYCLDTNEPQFFPRPISLTTGRRNLEWREVSGRGTIYSFTNTLNPWPGHESRVPYICALVDLHEGVRILANLYQIKFEEIKIGMPVKIYWEHLTEKILYPAFVPA